MLLVFRPGGKKLLSKGYVISEDDVRTLQSEGMNNIWVTELEEGEVGEDEAVCAAAASRLWFLRDQTLGGWSRKSDRHRDLLCSSR